MAAGNPYHGLHRDWQRPRVPVDQGRTYGALLLGNLPSFRSDYGRLGDAGTAGSSELVRVVAEAWGELQNTGAVPPPLFQAVVDASVAYERSGGTPTGLPPETQKQLADVGKWFQTTMAALEESAGSSVQPSTSSPLPPPAAPETASVPPIQSQARPAVAAVPRTRARAVIVPAMIKSRTKGRTGMIAVVAAVGVLLLVSMGKK